MYVSTEIVPIGFYLDPDLCFRSVLFWRFGATRETKFLIISTLTAKK